MEEVRQNVVIPASGSFRRGGGSALATKQMRPFPSAAMVRAFPVGAASQPRPGAAWTLDDASLWRDADRALAKMVIASRLAGDTGKERVKLERATASVRDALNEAAVAAAEAAQRAFTLAEALDDALTLLDGAQPGRGEAAAFAAAPGADGLSQREREVLAQVAKGRSNKAIADELYVSPNTVKTHVASLLRKLDVHTRAQLAAIAVQQGM